MTTPVEGTDLTPMAKIAYGVLKEPDCPSLFIGLCGFSQATCTDLNLIKTRAERDRLLGILFKKNAKEKLEAYSCGHRAS